MPLHFLCKTKPSHVISKERLSILHHRFMLFFSSSSTAALKVTEFIQEPKATNHAFPSYIELRQKMLTLAKSGFLQDALETLNHMRYYVPGKPTVMDYNGLLEYYLKSDSVNLEFLIEVYNTMWRFGPSPNVYTFIIMLNGLLRKGYFGELVVIVEEMCCCGFVPSFSLFMKMVKKLLRSGYLVQGIRLFEVMSYFGYVPSALAFSLLIDRFCELGMISQAYFVFCDLLEKRCDIGSRNLNPILWALCKSQRSYEALALFGLVKKKSITCNECSYAALIYGFSRERLWEQVSSCLKGMQSDGYKPNVKTYTSVVKFLCDDGDTDEALAFLDKMARQGCDPDMVTNNVILRELCHHYRINEASELLGFCKKGLSPGALAGGLLKAGKGKMVVEVLCGLFSKGYALDTSVYNIYLHSLRCDNKVEEALSFLKFMEEHGWAPNNVSYNTVLNGFCREGNIDKALELFQSFNWVANRPDVVSFNTILSAACKNEKHGMVLRILDSMENAGVKWDVVSSTTLIEYCFKVGNIADGLKMLESMRSNGPSPTIVTLNIVMNNLCKNREIEMAHRIFNDLRSYGLSADVISYNILIHAAILEGENSLVTGLLREMQSLGIAHDAVTYNSLIKGLCEDGKLVTALGMKNAMYSKGLTPSIVTYNTILNAMLRTSNSRGMVQLLKDMAIKRCEFDVVSCKILIQAASKFRMEQNGEIFVKFVKWLNIWKHYEELTS